MRRPIRLNKEELEELAGVKFSARDLVDLADLCTVYAERFRRPPLPDFMLPVAPITAQEPRVTELEARRAFVEAVEGVWRERHRKRGLGSTYR